MRVQRRPAAFVDDREAEVDLAAVLVQRVFFVPAFTASAASSSATEST